MPCRQTANADFDYEFSTDPENPTITFIPTRAGVGTPTLIFYYGTGGGPWPGYGITPNTPFALNNASAGDTIGFYFTYSTSAGERNTLGDNAKYTIGTCGEPAETEPAIAIATWRSFSFNPDDLADAGAEDTIWGDLADPDLDGLVNLFEFLTGSDPLEPSPSPLTWGWNELTGHPYVRFYRRAGLPDGYLTLEQTTDLALWSADTSTIAIVSLEDGYEQVEIEITAPPSSADVPRIIRLLATP